MKFYYGIIDHYIDVTHIIKNEFCNNDTLRITIPIDIAIREKYFNNIPGLCELSTFNKHFKVVNGNKEIIYTNNTIINIHINNIEDLEIINPIIVTDNPVIPPIDSVILPDK